MKKSSSDENKEEQKWGELFFLFFVILGILAVASGFFIMFFNLLGFEIIFPRWLDNLFSY